MFERIKDWLDQPVQGFLEVLCLIAITLGLCLIVSVAFLFLLLV